MKQVCWSFVAAPFHPRQHFTKYVKVGIILLELESRQRYCFVFLFPILVYPPRVCTAVLTVVVVVDFEPHIHKFVRIQEGLLRDCVYSTSRRPRTIAIVFFKYHIQPTKSEACCETFRRRRRCFRSKVTDTKIGA